MENQKKLKDLLESIVAAKNAEAAMPEKAGDTSAFNNVQMQQQANSPSLLEEEDTPTIPQINTVPAGQTPQELAVVKQIEAESQAALERQKLELQRQRELNKIYSGAGSGYSNLSPLLNFTSQMTGIDVSKGYVAPMTAQEAAKQAMDMEGRIPKLEDSLADNQLNLLRMKLQNAQRKGDMGRQARFEQGQDTQISFKLDQPYQKLQSEKNDFDRAYSTISGALNRGDYGSIQGSLSMLARLSGEKGVLTDQDIARVVPVNLEARMTKLMADLRSDPSTKVPQEIIQALKNNISGLVDAHNKTYKNSLEGVYALHEPTGGRIAELSKKKKNSLLSLLEKTQAQASQQVPSLRDAILEMRSKK